MHKLIFITRMLHVTKLKTYAGITIRTKIKISNMLKQTISVDFVVH